MILFLVETTGKAGFPGRLALLRDGQRNLSSLVIILLIDKHGYAVREGIT